MIGTQSPSFLIVLLILASSGSRCGVNPDAQFSANGAISDPLQVKASSSNFGWWLRTPVADRKADAAYVAVAHLMRHVSSVNAEIDLCQVSCSMGNARDIHSNEAMGNGQPPALPPRPALDVSNISSSSSRTPDTAHPGETH